MSLEIIGLFIYPFINVVAFSVILSKITKVKYRPLVIVMCLILEVVVPFIIALLGHIFSFSNIIPSYSLSFFLPLFLACYFSRVEKIKRYESFFLSFFLCLSIDASTTFFSVIISSVLGNDFVTQYMGVFLTSINLISLFFMVRIIDIFDFRITCLKRSVFKSQILIISISYAVNWLILNFSHWISNINHFNSFSSMIATICFLAFLSTLVTFKDSREKYEKEEHLRQKESEQLRLQEYTDEIVRLYNEIKGFRHDYASMLTSMQMAVQIGDIKEIERIYQEVLADANLDLRSDKYTIFELGNVGDSALRSVMTETIFQAREHQLQLTFEVKDKVERLPIKLLDLVRIASILLNNAIEGAIESLEKMVHVSLVQLDDRTIFVVQNSRKEGRLDLEELYQPEFSTKGKDRGCGLNNIKEILDRYEFITLDTQIEKSDFIQILTIREENL